jgi:Cof subfamily protein (haloacid dehalogenase superfamily)
MYKLLATDVDGTLLDSNSKLTEFNKKALQDCIASGINVIIATGKSINSTMFIVKELGLRLPQITLGGAVVITPERKIVSSFKIPPELYLDVIGTIKDRGYEPVMATVDGNIYCQEYSKQMSYLNSVGEKIIKADDLTADYFKNNVVFISIPINEKDPMDLFIREKYKDKLQVIRSGDYFFDILSLNTSKGKTLTALIKEWGIRKEEVVSFGDSPNDVSLFKASGLKIAVKNSYPELLEIADIVTDENYKNGLGRAIYKYVLKKELPINFNKFAYSSNI